MTDHVTLIQYRGVNAHGVGVVGRCQTGQAAADAALEFYRRGFRKLILTRDGEEVGGIRTVGRKRTWWGENER